MGRSVVLVQDELDQGQHDRNTDVWRSPPAACWSAAPCGRRSAGSTRHCPTSTPRSTSVSGPVSPGTASCVVPDARASTAGPIEEFGRKRVSEARRVRLHRQAQLHRRMSYAPAAVALPLHWLTLVPFAIGRAVGHLVAKHPAAVSGELAAAVAVAFGGGVARSRRALARSKRLGWAAVEPLRISWRRVHERRTT